MDGLARRRGVGPHGGGDRPVGRSRFTGEDADVEESRRWLFELRFALGVTARRVTYRFTGDGRIVLLTTFRKQRSNERGEVARAREVAERCARSNP